MSGTAPQSSGVPSVSPEHDADEVAGAGRHGTRRPGASWWLVVVVAVALVVLLVAQPWATQDDTPVPTPTATAEAPAPSPEQTATASAAPPPGSAAVFDAATAASLLVTAPDLEGAVPAAARGVERRVQPGSRPWGLPAGGAVTPVECTLAVTVVDRPPLHYDAASWGNDELVLEQEVVVLGDAETARAAFRALVTTLDSCPEYAVTFPDVGAGASRTEWVADPAIEGQGVFPSVVHDLTSRTADAVRPQTAGHVLVGNTIVTWIATASAAQDEAGRRAALGPAQDLAAMVEERALTAVRALP